LSEYIDRVGPVLADDYVIDDSSGCLDVVINAPEPGRNALQLMSNCDICITQEFDLVARDASSYKPNKRQQTTERKHCKK
jgi:hypothetical protein